jgi:two-component system chemotaxis response regulator CheB
MAQNTIDTAQRLLLTGGSAGSLDVILKILPHLNRQSGYAAIVVVHRRAVQDSLLEVILAAKTDWQVKEAEEKEWLLPGHIYIAPPDYHLLVENDHSLTLDDSEKVNYSRPSIDATFESAAEAYGKNAIAVLLSGANADGVEGLQRIKELGGTCIVQSPESAEVAYMPEQAIRNVAVDHTVADDELGSFINTLLMK